MPRTSSMWPLAAEYTPCSRETTSSAPSAAVGAYLGSESATCCMRWRSSLHQSAEMSISAIFLTIYTSSKQHQTVATSDSGNIRQRQHQTAATSDSSSTSGNIPDRTATSDSGNIRQQQHQWQHTGSNSCSLRYRSEYRSRSEPISCYWQYGSCTRIGTTAVGRTTPYEYSGHYSCTAAACLLLFFLRNIS
jgi:hypothetical protein